MIIHFVSKTTGKRYRVLAIDKTQDPPLLTLQGEHSKFTQPFDKELFKRCGYDLVKTEVEETADAQG